MEEGKRWMEEGETEIEGYEPFHAFLLGPFFLVTVYKSRNTNTQFLNKINPNNINKILFLKFHQLST